MTRTRTMTPIALALIGALIAHPLHAQSEDANAAESPVVTVTTATLGEVETRISVSGTLVAAEEVLINTRINGYAIEAIQVEVGDVVEAGSVLASLDDSAPSAQLAQAEAELVRSNAAIGQAKSQIDATTATLTEADANLQRNQRLRESGNISEATLEQARAAASSARANVASARDGLNVAEAQRTSAQSQRDLAKLTLARTEITAPVAGIISARNAQLGEIASGGGEPMFRLIRNGELEVAVQVVETALGGLDKGDEAIVNVAGVGSVTGMVRLVPPTVDPRTRLGSVRLSLSANPSLKAGLSASGWIIIDRHESITVPASAVLTQGLASHVQLVVDGVVQTRPVTAGVLSANGSREVLEGLEGGEQVIARAGAFFIDGDEVRAVITQNNSEAIAADKP